MCFKRSDRFLRSTIARFSGAELPVMAAAGQRAAGLCSFVGFPGQKGRLSPWKLFRLGSPSESLSIKLLVPG